MTDFEKAFIDVYKSEVDEFQSQHENLVHIFSKKFKSDFNKIRVKAFETNTEVKHLHIKRALLVCILLVILSFSALTVIAIKYPDMCPKVIKDKINLILDYEKPKEIFCVGKNDAKPIVPRGYKIMGESMDRTSHFIDYNDEKKNYIFYEKRTIDGIKSILDIYNAKFKCEKLKGHDVYVIRHSYQTIFTWNDGKYEYLWASEGNYDDLRRIVTDNIE